MSAATLLAPDGGTVDLFWIPLGAGHHSVRFNGIVYEALNAATERRDRCDLYHSVLERFFAVLSVTEHRLTHGQGG